MSVENADFYDGWEDGEYTTDPAWEVYQQEGDFDATVVDRPAPDGGEKALSVVETTGGGTSGVIGWADSVEGWDGSWTLSGLFYTAEVPLNTPFQGHALHPYYDPTTGESPLTVRLGFRDGNGNVRPFEIDGALVDTVESSHDPGWQEDTWYRYEVSHDGEGRYEGSLWPANGSRPAEPNAESVGAAPGSDARVGSIRVNGARNRSFDIQHAFMDWRGGTVQPGPNLVSGSATTLTLLSASEYCIDPPQEGDDIDESWDGNCEDTSRAEPGAPDDRKKHHALANAMPDYWGHTLDAWFIGDQTSALPDDLDKALEIRKDLAEYPGEEFRQYRVKNQLSVSFPSSDGRAIDDWSEVTVESSRDEKDPYVLVEGEQGEANVMRSLIEDAPDPVFPVSDGVQELFEEIEGDEKKRAESEIYPEPDEPLLKGEETNRIEIGGVEGVRVSQIYGGKDTYVRLLSKIYWRLIRTHGQELGTVRFKTLTGMSFAAIPGFIINPPTMYTFLDIAVMADGSKAVRVWDASPYPKQYLYVNARKQDENDFKEGAEKGAIMGTVKDGNWHPRQDVNVEVFADWVEDAQLPATPFDPYSPLAYTAFYPITQGASPVMIHGTDGEEISSEQLIDALPRPLFPWTGK